MNVCIFLKLINDNVPLFECYNTSKHQINDNWILSVPSQQIKLCKKIFFTGIFQTILNKNNAIVNNGIVKKKQKLILLYASLVALFFATFQTISIKSDSCCLSSYNVTEGAHL